MMKGREHGPWRRARRRRPACWPSLSGRGADNGAALDLLRGKGDILAFQAWASRASWRPCARRASRSGPPEP